MTSAPARGRGTLHPIVPALWSIPALVSVLLSNSTTFLGGLLLALLLVALLRGPRFAAWTAVASAVTVAALWLGFVPWLPVDASPPLTALPFSPTHLQALAALRGALRLTAAAMVVAVPAAWVQWRVLGDWLIERGVLPYRLVDAAAMGERLVARMLADLRQTRHLTELRSRGSRLTRLRYHWQAFVPTLIAAFRHGDELALSLESRGFGIDTTRTVHHAVPLLAKDVVVLALASAAVAVAAVAAAAMG